MSSWVSRPAHPTLSDRHSSPGPGVQARPALGGLEEFAALDHQWPRWEHLSAPDERGFNGSAGKTGESERLTVP